MSIKSAHTMITCSSADTMEQSNRYRANILILLLLAAAMLCTAALYRIFEVTQAQCAYLKLGLFDEEIISVTLVEYEGEPFRSGISYEKKYLDSALFNSIKDTLNAQRVVLPADRNTNRVLFIEYRSSETLTVMLYEDALGLEYGRICFRAEDIWHLFE